MSIATSDPHVASIAPSEIPQGWTGTMTVTGAGFNKDSAVMIEASFPKTTYRSATQLEAEVEATISATPGSKGVKVHQLDTGTLSNEVTLVVKPKTAPTTR